MAKKRKKGNGTIRLRKDGRWEGRVVVGYDEKGFPKTKNVLARTKGECLQKLKLLRESLETPQPEITSSNITFGEWLDCWYQNFCKPAIKPRTQENYEDRVYRYIVPKLGGIPLKKLSQNDLLQFLAELKQSGRLHQTDRYGEGLSNRTVRGCRDTCWAALDKAAEIGLISSNPAEGCKPPKTQPKEMKILSAEEMQRLLIQAKEDGCYELLLLELSTGLRRGEILALQWDDLSFKTGELRIERQVHRVRGKLEITPPKTKAGNRIVILPPPVLNALSEYRQTVSSRWMFPSPRKEDAPRDPAAVRKRLQTVLERAECSRVRFHDLRHAFATMSLNHGMDLKTLSTVIGHASAATTLNVYAHITDEMRQSAAVKIDKGIAGVEAPERTEEQPRKPQRQTFQAKKGKIRKRGTGCVSRLNDLLWEGRYSPIWSDGKKHSRCVYAETEADCESKLAELIAQMKAEIAEEKGRRREKRQAG